MERLVIDARVPDLSAGAPVSVQWSEGFAVLPVFGRRAHWFIREAPRPMSIDGVPLLATPVTAACGHTRFEVGSVGLLTPGRYEVCQRCAAARGGK